MLPVAAVPVVLPVVAVPVVLPVVVLVVSPVKATLLVDVVVSVDVVTVETSLGDVDVAIPDVDVNVDVEAVFDELIVGLTVVVDEDVVDACASETAAHKNITAITIDEYDIVYSNGWMN